MNPLATFLLRAKHWQIFILVIGPFIIGMAIEFNSDWKPISTTGGLGTASLTSAMLCLIFYFGFLAWLWASGTFLHSILRPELRMKTRFFRFSIIYPALYFFLFFATFFTSKPIVLALIFPLHALATFSMFYLLYFVSKNLVSAEAGKPVTFSDYAGPFFLLWFFPIGIWFVQPRLNRLYGRHL